jgi:uncharacterized membrane protein
MSIEPIASRPAKKPAAVAPSARSPNVVGAPRSGSQRSRRGAVLERRPRRTNGHPRGIYVTSSLTVDRTPEDVYRFWRDLTNLPRFMAHLESVELREPHVRLRARLPAGIELEWDAQITADRPNERIQWGSLPDADIEGHGMVRFTPTRKGGGTEVQVMLRYTHPAGAVGAAFAKRFGKHPVQQVRADLERFKKLLENGDTAPSEASPHSEAKVAPSSAKSRQAQPKKPASP